MIYHANCVTYGYIDVAGKKGKGDKRTKYEQKTSEISISVPTAESSMYYWMRLFFFTMLITYSLEPWLPLLLVLLFLFVKFYYVHIAFQWNVRSKTDCIDSIFLALPEGVVPLFLSTKTQEAFGIHADIEVTAENPMKIISKEQVLQDLYNRAAISDFHPVKPMMVVCRWFLLIQLYYCIIFFSLLNCHVWWFLTLLSYQHGFVICLLK